MCARPLGIVAIIAVLYAGWLGTFFATGHEVRDLIRIGAFVLQSDRSDEIRFDPSYDYPQNRDPERQGFGYDGQFYYYLALDPSNARYYMDEPGYRYTRPGYPAAARALALGRSELVPWALLAINLLAVGLGTLALAAWLVREGHHPWPALVYGLSPGLLLAVQRDLTEPLAYAFVAAAFLALQRRGRWSWVFAAALLALAVLTRQTTAVFAPILALAVLLSGQGPLMERARTNVFRAGAFLALSVMPYLVYWAAIDAWLGQTTGSDQFSAIPFGGLFSGRVELVRQGVVIPTVVVPVLIWMGLAGVLLRGRIAALVRGRAAAWVPAACLLVNGLLFMVFREDSNAYTARGRTVLGVALMAAMCTPAMASLGRRARAWHWAAILLWVSMLPVIAVYGLTTGSI